MSDHDLPYVLIHILAKDKEKTLPYWLEQNLDNLDYPREKVILYFRTNNNNDDTARIIRQWVDDQYTMYDRQESDSYKYDWRHIEVDDRDVEEQVQRFGVHEWNAERFSVLGRLREEGIAMANFWDCHYFVCDVDNYVLPETLKTLLETGRAVVAPILRSADSEQLGYSNFHHPCTPNGYYQDSEEYFAILNGIKREILPVDVVHCTYLIRREVLDKILYQDGTEDYEYVIFSRNLRNLGIQQYLDNRKIYGYLTLRENVDACKEWMAKLK